jgi:hypothetical protein
MADKPVFPAHLLPPAWEKVKGPLTKTAIKTDVKGALEALYKQFWNATPWEHLLEIADFNDSQHDRFVESLDKCIAAAQLVSTRARAAIGEIDKKPLSKTLLKTSRAYLVDMETDADDLDEAIDKVKTQIDDARAKVQRSQAKAAASFAGWVKAEYKRAAELAEECEQWTTAGFKSMAMLATGTGNDPESQRRRAEAQKIHDNMDKKITGFFNTLHEIDHEVDQKALAAPANDQPGHAAVATFKANISGLLKAVQRCHQELHARPIPQAQVVQGAASGSQG